MNEFNYSAICTTSHLLRRQGMTKSEAMRRSWAVEKLLRRMKAGIVRFSYTKKSGETRTALGTTDPHREPISGEQRDSVRYWDVEKHAYRMFRTCNLILT